ncbi:hypothetical protein SERLA73DRAFT_148148, partial [Serpula lacrymans var. lacrymans S7.3]
MSARIVMSAVVGVDSTVREDGTSSYCKAIQHGACKRQRKKKRDYYCSIHSMHHWPLCAVSCWLYAG